MGMDLNTKLRKFHQAIAVDDRYGPAYNNLGLLFYEQGSLYDAVLAFESAMEHLRALVDEGLGRGHLFQFRCLAVDRRPQQPVDAASQSLQIAGPPGFRDVTPVCR